MTRRTFPFVFAVVALSQVGATECGQALRDPGFDLWCGKALCAWTVERGTVERVPTWNEGDPGVAFTGTDVAIAQLSPVNGGDENSGCIEFDLIANVDENAELDLNVDVNGDGTFEFTERIPTSRWQPLAFKLPIANTYSGIRFELAKKGSGNAAVAQLAAQTSTGCAGLTPIVPAPAPNGARCVTALGGADCQSGRCGGTPLFAGVCTGCDGGPGECAANETCGIGDATSPIFGVPLECVPANARVLGEQCLFDGECTTGLFCTNGFCSTCKMDNTGCATGTCGAAWPTLGEFGGIPLNTPFECDPSAHERASGEPCANDADCASGSCAGAPRMQCGDGRSCTTAADCPYIGLENGPCTTVGVQGGICR